MLDVCRASFPGHSFSFLELHCGKPGTEVLYLSLTNHGSQLTSSLAHSQGNLQLLSEALEENEVGSRKVNAEVQSLMNLLNI